MIKTLILLALFLLTACGNEDFKHVEYIKTEELNQELTTTKNDTVADYLIINKKTMDYGIVKNIEINSNYDSINIDLYSKKQYDLIISKQSNKHHVLYKYLGTTTNHVLEVPKLEQGLYLLEIRDPKQKLLDQYILEKVIEIKEI
jgi:hypothetical protein